MYLKQKNLYDIIIIFVRNSTLLAAKAKEFMIFFIPERNKYLCQTNFVFKVFYFLFEVAKYKRLGFLVAI